MRRSPHRQLRCSGVASAVLPGFLRMSSRMRNGMQFQHVDAECEGLEMSADGTRRKLWRAAGKLLDRQREVPTADTFLFLTNHKIRHGTSMLLARGLKRFINLRLILIGLLRSIFTPQSIIPVKLIYIYVGWYSPDSSILLPTPRSCGHTCLKICLK